MPMPLCPVAPAPPRLSPLDDRDFAAMIGLSVAVGRFVEALFWAIFRVAGAVAVAVILGLAVLVVVLLIVRRLIARRS